MAASGHAASLSYASEGQPSKVLVGVGDLVAVKPRSFGAKKNDESTPDVRYYLGHYYKCLIVKYCTYTISILYRKHNIKMYRA